MLLLGLIVVYFLIFTAVIYATLILSSRISQEQASFEIPSTDDEEPVPMLSDRGVEIVTTH
jgi:predicted secreted protein